MIYIYTFNKVEDYEIVVESFRAHDRNGHFSDDDLTIETEDSIFVDGVLDTYSITDYEFEGPDSRSLPGEDMDGDFDSGMASAGFGADEDYGDYGYNGED